MHGGDALAPPASACVAGKACSLSPLSLFFTKGVAHALRASSPSQPRSAEADVVLLPLVLSLLAHAQLRAMIPACLRIRGCLTFFTVTNNCVWDLPGDEHLHRPRKAGKVSLSLSGMRSRQPHLWSLSFRLGVILSLSTSGAFKLLRHVCLTYGEAFECNLKAVVATVTSISKSAQICKFARKGQGV